MTPVLYVVRSVPFCFIYTADFLGILIWGFSAKRREFREKNFEEKTNLAGSIWSIEGNLYIV